MPAERTAEPIITPVRDPAAPTAELSTPPAAVLWDMDGTLVDSEKVWSVSLAELATRLGGTLTDGARAAIVGTDTARTMTLLFADLGLAPDPDAISEAGHWLNTRTAELFGHGLEWRPGAQAALRTVRAAGWPTALVTNTRRSLTELALDGIGREWFDVSVCGDEVDAGKPAPDPYRRAAALLGVAAADCLVIEDSPTGTRSGTAAGAAVLVVPCEVDVPAAPGVVFRDSLTGLTAADLHADYTEAIRGRTA